MPTPFPGVSALAAEAKAGSKSSSTGASFFGACHGLASPGERPHSRQRFRPSLPTRTSVPPQCSRGQRLDFMVLGGCPAGPNVHGHDASLRV
jgi:hypothetical protein